MGHRDWIELSTFRVDCILGILDHEQQMAQPLDVQIRMALDLDPAGDLDRLDCSVDYAAVTEQVTFLVTVGRFRLLETMALSIARLLLAPPAPGEGRAAIQRVELRLAKPAVLGGRAVPGIGILRDAAWAVPRTRDIARGISADVLHECERNAGYRLHLDAGAEWQSPIPMALYALSDIEINGKAAPPGTKLDRGKTRKLRNPGDRPACVLGVTFPGAL